MGVARPPLRRLLVLLVAAVVVLLPMSPGSATPGPGTGPGKHAGTMAGDAKDKAEDVWTGVPGTNLAHDTYGYPWPAAPDCNEADVAGGGCVDDGRGFFQGQCTSWVAFRVSQRNGISFSNWYGGVHWGNAADWAKVAKGLGYQRNRVPAPGAIGWYRRGHVSYVEDVYSDGGVVISEMNTDGHNGFHLTTVYPGSSGYPDRFIHVADVVPVDYTAPGRPTPVTVRHLERGVAVSWDAPADDVGVTGYRVLRNGMPLAETSTPAYVDRQASPHQRYTYTVVAHDAAGNQSEPATQQLDQDVPAPARLRGPLLDATEVSTAAGPAVCGRMGTTRRQHLGCRVRVGKRWRTYRTGREVPWGQEHTRSFVAAPDETRVWFCRELARGRNACLPQDLTTGSWGFDRIGRPGQAPAYAVWVATRTGAARCGVAGDRATCSVLAPHGWKAPRRTTGARPGDPLSRAFVAVPEGVAFCRVVEGSPTCSTLALGRRTWQPAVSAGRDVAHGRWTVRRAGPTLCPEDSGECRVVTRPGAANAPETQRASRRGSSTRSSTPPPAAAVTT